MSVQFLAKGSFALRARHLFVIHGEVLEGVVEPGMTVTIPSGTDVPFVQDIQSVEYLDSVGIGQADVALTFRYLDDEQLEHWVRLPVENEVLAISPAPQPFACPCCGFYTLTEEPPGTYEICPVCFWEDDPVQFENPDYEGGANRVSLNEARKQFKEAGVSEDRFKKYVRAPRPNEFPPQAKG